MYFKTSEFRVTDTGYPNLIEDASVRRNLRDLMYTLNVLRGIIGCPITILSGYRSYLVNEMVGGSETSYHLKGRAADITCKKLHELLDYCLKLKESKIFVEVIYYPDKYFIHVAI